jgi:hypothetical protein
MNTIDAVWNTTWTYSEDVGGGSVANAGTKGARNVPHLAQILFESDFSSIVLVPAFFSAEQCQQLADASVPVEGSVTEDAAQQRHVPLSAKSEIGPLLAKLSQLVVAHAQTSAEFDRDPILTIQIQERLAPPPPTSSDKEKAGAGACATLSETGDPSAAGECSSERASGPDVGGGVHRRRAVAPDGGVAAQLRIVCPASDVVGGSVHYPKAGVHVNPADAHLGPGYALLTLYQDPRTGRREPDPFVEEVVECDVKQGRLVSIVLDVVAGTA